MAVTAAKAKTELFIGNQWAGASDGAVYEDTNPATGAVIAQVANASAADVDRAVTAARNALERGKWSTMAASRRAKIVYKIAQLIAERGERV